MKIIKVSLGVYHAAAITDQGLLFTWGRGINGQLGHGKMQNEVQKTKRIYRKNLNNQYKFVPINI